MTDKEIIICKEVIKDLQEYCFLTQATYRRMGYEFCQNDFIHLNNLIDLINRQKEEIERKNKLLEKAEKMLETKIESEK